MTSLKKLGAAVVLTVGLTLAAYADCPVPGIMNGPPCTAVQTAPDDPTAPGQIQAPPASETQPVSVSVELPSLAEIALNFLVMF